MDRRPDPEPLEGNDVRVVAAGTALWFLLGLALLPFASRLDRGGHLWWIAACFTGAGLGLVGVRYCVRRRRARVPAPSPQG